MIQDFPAAIFFLITAVVTDLCFGQRSFLKIHLQRLQMKMASFLHESLHNMFCLFSKIRDFSAANIFLQIKHMKDLFPS